MMLVTPLGSGVQPASLPRRPPARFAYPRAARSWTQALQYQRQCRRIRHAANLDRGQAQLDLDAAGIDGIGASLYFGLGRQRHRQELRRRAQQAGTQLPAPAKQHVRVQPVLHCQLGYRHRLVARLLRQAPLELQRIIRAAPTLLLF